MKKFAILFLFLTSCSTAGPYITGFEPTKSGMIVKSCYVEFIPLVNTIREGDCDSTYVENAGNQLPTSLAGAERTNSSPMPIINNFK